MQLQLPYEHHHRRGVPTFFALVATARLSNLFGWLFAIDELHNYHTCISSRRNEQAAFTIQEPYWTDVQTITREWSSELARHVA